MTRYVKLRTVTEQGHSSTAWTPEYELSTEGLGYTAEDVANKDTDSTLSANSDTKYPSQKAVKTFVENELAQVATGESVQGSFLVGGGQVTWETAYTFRVSAASYYINGVQYSSAEQTITLDDADAGNDRIDVIAVDDSGSVVKISGTAAAQPSEPDVNPSTQLKLAFVFVAANTTEPEGVANTSLYAENAGSGGGEWDWTTSGSGFNVNSTNNPRSGTKTIEGTNVANNAYAQGQKGSGTVDPNSFDVLVFYIRSKATWNNNRVLRVQLLNAGVRKGNVLTIASGFFGFDSSNTTDYQQVAIPLVQFAIPAGTLINQIRLVDSGGAIGFYIDDVSFQVGAISQTGTGLSQAQADARYLQRNSNLSDLANAATARSNLSLPFELVIAVSDETTPLEAAEGVLTFRMPRAITLTGIRASLTTAQDSGTILTIDVKEGGSTILSTKITIDNGEKTSTTAATPPVISDPALADDAEITIDIDQIGNGTATGLKVTLIGVRA